MDRPVALVTGSTSGIGASVVRRLAAEGFEVIVHSRQSRQEGERLAAELGGTYVAADLSHPEAAAEDLLAHVGSHGRLDVLVNNAGVSRRIPHGDLAQATPQIWQELMTVNVVAPWILTSVFLTHLRAAKLPGGGCIVNISSHAGVRPKGASIPYAASKAALNHTTKLLALALGPEVRVNAVAPGLVQTPMSSSWPEAQALWEARSPMQRAAQPEDVAHIVSAVVLNRYLTGEVIVLDGGLHLT